jgi:hypothetical protein
MTLNMSVMDDTRANLLSFATDLALLVWCLGAAFKELRMASVVHLNEHLRHLQGARTISTATKQKTIPGPMSGNKERMK